MSEQTLYQEWCEIMKQTENERDRIIFDAGMTFMSIESRAKKQAEVKPITAQIQKTVYGDYYITLDANTTAQKILLTDAKNQAEERGRKFELFGGAAGPVDDEGIDLHLDYRMSIITREDKPIVKPKKKKFYDRVGNRGTL